MSILDRRLIEKVSCAGIAISTFLSDDRSRVLVSVSDIVEALAMDVDLEDEFYMDYVAYDQLGNRSEHKCVVHSDVNHLLWLHDCSPKFVNELDDFRRYFLHEVITFWNRFESAPASLSVRDAVRLIDRKVIPYIESMDIPPSLVYHMAIKSLGYEYIVPKENLTTEELSFVAYSELLYASLVGVEVSDGNSTEDAVRIVERRLKEPMKALGVLTRGVVGCS